MAGADPHIHVERGVTRYDARVRNLLAGTFGLAGDLPATVVTGCSSRCRTR
ncbi:hypothetical protein ACFQ6S_09595 [Streptomyces sp. NPDC056479]|uniref:hypothetical protein n=1 Tax=Streptomyces sp. NPDC056479 TaxID=3345832 RepID=UPI003685F08E